MSEQVESTEIPAVSISLETSESAETCREVFIQPDRPGRADLSRSLTLGSSTSCRTRVPALNLANCGASSSSRGSLGRTDNNVYGVSLSSLLPFVFFFGISKVALGL